MDLKRYIRADYDFKPGIPFWDINTLMAEPKAYDFVINAIAREWDGKADVVAALESRGFYFGPAVARQLGLRFVPIRKKGKTPGPVYTQPYGLEYRPSDEMELGRDLIAPGSRVLVIDDVLATGGSAEAAWKLVRQAGADVAGYAFVIELEYCSGRDKLPDVPVQSLVTYAADEIAAKAA